MRCRIDKEVDSSVILPSMPIPRSAVTVMEKIIGLDSSEEDALERAPETMITHEMEAVDETEQEMEAVDETEQGDKLLETTVPTPPGAHLHLSGIHLLQEPKTMVCRFLDPSDPTLNILLLKADAAVITEKLPEARALSS